MKTSIYCKTCQQSNVERKGRRANRRISRGRTGGGSTNVQIYSFMVVNPHAICCHRKSKSYPLAAIRIATLYFGALFLWGKWVSICSVIMSINSLIVVSSSAYWHWHVKCKINSIKHNKRKWINGKNGIWRSLSPPSFRETAVHRWRKDSFCFFQNRQPNALNTQSFCL